MKSRLPYGKEYLELDLPDDWATSVLVPNRAEPLADPLAAVRSAIESIPPDLRARLRAARRIAIAVNDKTRPVPHDLLLPPLLDLFEGLEIEPQRVLFLVATGAHPPMRPDEFSAILPKSVVDTCEVVSHDAKEVEGLVSMGSSSRGTPALFNRRYAEADFRIVVGNIEPHQFMGFSGGVKSAVIGLAGHETIDRNHSLMSAKGSLLGSYEGNPARQDVEELGRLLRVDLALNGVLDDSKRIVEVLCGDPAEVMRRGIPIVRRLFEVPTPGLFDLTFASPGGHPKDINLYQAQKALAHAALLTRPGGTIVLAAACPEGTGSEDYEAWVTRRRSQREVIRDFELQGFRVGPHKAFQIARDSIGRSVYLVSEIKNDLVRRLLLEPVNSLEEAVRRVRTSMRANAKVAVMPYANATIPLQTGDVESDPRRTTDDGSQ